MKLAFLLVGWKPFPVRGTGFYDAGTKFMQGPSNKPGTTQGPEPVRELGVGHARGRLKIFFGYAPGVGRTRTMLQEARSLAEKGVDVAVATLRFTPGSGISDAVSGLGSLPPSPGHPEQRDASIFSLDGALKRRPRILIIGGLAERNKAGARHCHRYQDAIEILDAGIDVWATLEVRHIASLAEIVQAITGSVARDFIPDVVFDDADEVEIVDMPPDDLLRRMDDSRMTGALQEKPMSRQVLVALREIALRRAADRLNLRMQKGAGAATSSATWRTRERLVGCVGPSPTSLRVIHTASRMATSMHAQWIALHVSRTGRTGPIEDARLAQHLKLAESLGAETVTLAGGDIAREVVSYARTRSATKIVIGKTGVWTWRNLFSRSIVDRVISGSCDMDVHVIRGNGDAAETEAHVPESRRFALMSYLSGASVIAVATGMAWGFRMLGLSEANIVLAFLLGVAAAAAWLGRGPSIFASFLAVLSFNFFFTEPRFTLLVNETQYVFTFAVMLVIALLVSTLTSRIREHSEASVAREKRTEMMYQFSRKLSATTGRHQIVSVAEQQLAEILKTEVAILLPDADGRIGAVTTQSGLGREPSLRSMAQWVFEHGKMAGAGTETHSEGSALCLPLASPEGTVGVLAMKSSRQDLLFLPDMRRLLDVFSSQVALAILRDRLAEGMHKAVSQAETEKLRSALLSSVSHDFRTPLAAITGASSSLIEAGDHLPLEDRKGLLLSIYEESYRLERLVENLLHMTRLESGQMPVNKDWNLVDDIIGSALTRLSGRLKNRGISTFIGEALPMVSVDSVLIELVLINLIDNAVKHSHEDAPIEISARRDKAEIIMAVSDRGGGLTDEDKKHLFEKFYRGAISRSRGVEGAGLGLAICQAIIQLHHGRIWAQDRAGDGTEFLFSLPLMDGAPSLEDHERPQPVSE